MRPPTTATLRSISPSRSRGGLLTRQRSRQHTRSSTPKPAREDATDYIGQPPPPLLGGTDNFKRGFSRCGSEWSSSSPVQFLKKGKHRHSSAFRRQLGGDPSHIHVPTHQLPNQPVRPSAIAETHNTRLATSGVQGYKLEQTVLKRLLHTVDMGQTPTESPLLQLMDSQRIPKTHHQFIKCSAPQSGFEQLKDAVEHRTTPQVHQYQDLHTAQDPSYNDPLGAMYPVGFNFDDSLSSSYDGMFDRREMHLLRSIFAKAGERKAAEGASNTSSRATTSTSSRLQTPLSPLTPLGFSSKPGFA
eukprot:TRINITY_DN66158_c2_g1_i1.p2 TRINITY_DN66158_c2_g1~~TRINITY_DN66158_c2_g1_i1.p2  ORF type:complete len:301 (+),score=23.46 TRINITY_DN66158_c2_g1_i1:384-1286(+)